MVVAEAARALERPGLMLATQELQIKDLENKQLSDTMYNVPYFANDLLAFLRVDQNRHRATFFVCSCSFSPAKLEMYNSNRGGDGGGGGGGGGGKRESREGETEKC